MIIQIKYRDKANWDTIEGNSVNWVNYSQKFKNERIRPAWIAPIESVDVWNGRERDIQQIRWDSYSFDFYITENEINDLNRMRLCSDIVIIEYNQNSNGTYKSKEYIVDTSLNSYFNISEPEQIAQTASYKITITFRTNKTIINKADPVILSNYIDLIQNEDDWLELDSWNPGYGNPILLGIDEFKIIVLSSRISTFEKINGEWVEMIQGPFLPFTAVDATKLSNTKVAVVQEGLGLVVVYELIDNTWVQHSYFNITGVNTNPSIAGLSETLIATVDESNRDLIMYQYSGGVWAQVGSALNIIDITYPKIRKLTDSRIVLLDVNVGNLRTYDWSVGTWSNTSDTSVPVNGIFDLQAFSETRIIYIDEVNDDINIYDLNGTSWDIFGSPFSFDIGSLYSIAIRNYFSISITSAEDIIYDLNLGKYRYYTDFEIIENTKETELVKYDWPDGTQRILQKKQIGTNDFLHYLTSSDKVTFLERFKSSISIEINDISCIDYDFEVSDFADDYYKIIVKGIVSVIKNSFYQDADDYTLMCNSFPLYTEFPPLDSNTDAEIVRVDWPDGSQKIAQTSRRKAYDITFFRNSANKEILLNTLKENKTKTLGATTLSDFEIPELSEIGNDLWKIVVRGTYYYSIVNYSLTILNSHTLIIGTSQYYTDYPLNEISEDAEIETFSNESGVNIASKSITKTVKLAVFFLDRTSAFLLKHKFEKGNTTFTIDGYAILERRIITPEQIGIDLFRIECPCLISTDENP